MTLLLVYFAIAIFVSFLCSILEAVLLSITPSYIESLKEQGKGDLSANLNVLKKDIDKPLSAILSLNTIAHTIGAAGVGAQAAILWGDAYLGLVSGGLTLLILIFSEIVPKGIGARYWRSLASFAAKTLRILIWVTYPLVLMSQGITYLMSGNKTTVTVSRAEVSAMADIAHKEGIFHEKESKMLKNMIRLKTIKAEDVMTPRTVMFTMQEENPVIKLYENPDFNKFSRIPVYSENRDDITGFVHKTDVLTEMAEDHQDKKLTAIKRDIIMVPTDMNLPQILDKFIESKEHIALVVDKYGGVSGLISMEDVFETVLGIEIVDEYDSVEDMQSYARKKWRNRALRLGIISKEEHDQEEKENVIRYGITGGQPHEDKSDKP